MAQYLPVNAAGATAGLRTPTPTLRRGSSTWRRR